MPHPHLILLCLVSLLLCFAATPAHGQATRVGFYLRTCPRAESIVRSTVGSHFRSDPSVAPGLLRMHFHDCFVRGCDASVLIAGADSERTALPNLSLKGFEVIDDAKSQLESACPGVVSCADILALAARDSVVLTSGISWGVPTGRRDGRVSLASEANDLPGFTDSVDVQKQKFNAKGLNTQDLVTLVGGHTIGTTACQFFRYRLYNFTTAGDGSDPSINPSFVSRLRALCPENGDGSRRVGLDTGSPNRFDTNFFSNLRNGQGILESDQMLWTDASTRTFVQRFLGLRGLLGLTFNAEFEKSMVKMSNIEVLSGTMGEIRRTSGISWGVPTGRRDGRVSVGSEANDLPGFTDSVDVQKQKFNAKGLNTQDLVTLVGGHTIGTTACQFFRYRLYNFTTAGDGSDPSINPSFVSRLRALCPENGDGSRRVGLDTGSPNRFDMNFFSNLRNGQGILESDQMLWTDASTRTFVQRFMGLRGLLGLTFNAEFGKSMVKMSNIEVKSGTEGEIRRVCNAVNS